MKSWARGVIVLSLLATVLAIRGQQTLFDKLYPETLFGQARDHCIKAWGVLDELLSVQENNDKRGLFVDLALGQLLFAKSCLKKIDTKKARIAHDDMLDFSRIIGTILDRSEKIITLELGAKIVLLKQLTVRLQCYCQQIMGQLADLF